MTLTYTKYTESENLHGKISQGTVKLDVPVHLGTNIAALHKIPARPDKVSGMILRFQKQATHDLWFDKCKRLNRTGKKAT